jgi:uncharacterized phage protein gp47/JayE
MAFQRDYNELLNETLTNYRNEFGHLYDNQIVEGSVLYIKAAGMASAQWGLYQTLGKVADQIFVGTSDRAHLERHAAEYGIVTAGIPDAQIVDELLAAKRSKMSGGNKYDYAAWAREVTLGDEYITYAAVVPLARGEGTFDVVVVGSKNEGYASDGICDKIFDHIQSRRPIGSGFSWGMRVCSAIPEELPITIRGRGANWNQIAAQDAIVAYINTLLPHETLYTSQILSIMHQYGANAPEVVSPLGNPAPSESPVDGRYGMFRAGIVTIEE